MVQRSRRDDGTTVAGPKSEKQVVQVVHSRPSGELASDLLVFTRKQGEVKEKTDAWGFHCIQSNEHSQTAP